MKTYVREMKTLQAKLIFIDPKREHPETKAGAYMTRLLDNPTDDQKKEVYWLRDKWRSREEATDLDCFQVGKELQDVFQVSSIDFAQAAYGRKNQHNAAETKAELLPYETLVGWYMLAKPAIHGLSAYLTRSTRRKKGSTTLNFSVD